MGINGLLQQLKSISRPTHVSSYRGEKVAIDGYSWLHKGAYSCSRELCESLWTDGYVRYFVSRIDMLLANGVSPIVVFDGCRLPLKADEEDSRGRGRREALERARAHAESGNMGAANECYQRAVDVAPWMAKVVMEALRDRAAVRCIVAPYEADAQMAYLALRGEVHAVLTEDSDLLAYGCPRVLYKLDRGGGGEEVLLADLPLVRELNMAGFDHDMLLQMCVMAGCDFLPNLAGVGIKKAHAFLRKHRDFVKVLRVLRFNGTTLPPGYDLRFQRTIWLFRHQRVFCHASRTLRHLRPLPPGGLGASGVLVLAAVPPEGPELEALGFLGPPMEQAVAAGIADGDLDPSTLQPFDLATIYRNCPNPPQHLRPTLAQLLPAPPASQQHSQRLQPQHSQQPQSQGQRQLPWALGTQQQQQSQQQQGQRHLPWGASAQLQQQQHGSQAAAHEFTQGRYHGHPDQSHHHGHHGTRQRAHGRPPVAPLPPPDPARTIKRFFRSDPEASQPYRNVAPRGGGGATQAAGGGSGGGEAAPVVTLRGLAVEVLAAGGGTCRERSGRGDEADGGGTGTAEEAADGGEVDERAVAESQDPDGDADECSPPRAKRGRRHVGDAGGGTVAAAASGGAAGGTSQGGGGGSAARCPLTQGGGSLFGCFKRGAPGAGPGPAPGCAGGGAAGGWPGLRAGGRDAGDAGGRAMDTDSGAARLLRVEPGDSEDPSASIGLGGPAADGGKAHSQACSQGSGGAGSSAEAAAAGGGGPRTACSYGSQYDSQLSSGGEAGALRTYAAGWAGGRSRTPALLAMEALFSQPSDSAPLSQQFMAAASAPGLAPGPRQARSALEGLDRWMRGAGGGGVALGSGLLPGGDLPCSAGMSLPSPSRHSHLDPPSDGGDGPEQQEEREGLSAASPTRAHAAHAGAAGRCHGGTAAAAHQFSIYDIGPDPGAAPMAGAAGISAGADWREDGDEGAGEEVTSPLRAAARRPGSQGLSPGGGAGDGGTCGGSGGSGARAAEEEERLLEALDRSEARRRRTGSLMARLRRQVGAGAGDRGRRPPAPEARAGEAAGAAVGVGAGVQGLGVEEGAGADEWCDLVHGDVGAGAVVAAAAGVGAEEGQQEQEGSQQQQQQQAGNEFEVGEDEVLITADVPGSGVAGSGGDGGFHSVRHVEGYALVARAAVDRLEHSLLPQPPPGAVPNRPQQQQQRMQQQAQRRASLGSAHGGSGGGRPLTDFAFTRSAPKQRPQGLVGRGSGGRPTAAVPRPSIFVQPGGATAGTQEACGMGSAEPDLQRGSFFARSAGGDAAGARAGAMHYARGGDMADGGGGGDAGDGDDDDMVEIVEEQGGGGGRLARQALAELQLRQPFQPPRSVGQAAAPLPVKGSGKGKGGGVGKGKVGGRGGGKEQQQLLIPQFNHFAFRGARKP